MVELVSYSELMLDSDLVRYGGDAVVFRNHSRSKLVQRMAVFISELPNACWSERKHPLAGGTELRVALLVGSGAASEKASAEIESAYQQGVKDLAKMLHVSDEWVSECISLNKRQRRGGLQRA